MKTINLFIAAVVISVTAFTSVNAQTADEIVKKNIEATGGLKNWLKVNTLKETGSTQTQGTTIDITRTVVNNKAMRMDIIVAGVDGYTIVTNKEGWTFFPFQGQTEIQAMTPDQVKAVQDQLDIRGELFDYKAKGSKVDYVGKDSIDGKSCYKLLLTDKSGKVEVMYIDAATYFLVHSINKVKNNGEDMDVTVSLSDYQKVPEGIYLPMTINAQGNEVKFTSVEINKPVDDAIFKPSLK